MIGITVTMVIAAGVLTFFISFAKASMAMANYSDFEAGNRRLVQSFSQDVRDAEAVVWNSTDSVTLTTKGIPTTYSYDASTQVITRSQLGSPARELSRNLSEFSFIAYTLNEQALDIATNRAAASTNTKLIQIVGTFTKQIPNGNKTTAPLQSARIMLRNKPTSIP